MGGHSAQVGEHLDDGADQVLHVADRLVHERLFLVIKRDLDHLLHAV